MPLANLEQVAPVSSLAALHERGHVAVFGKTRSGKSEFLKKAFRETHLLAFFANPHREPLKALTVATPKELRRGLQEGHRRFQWCPPRNSKREALQESLMGFVDVLLEVGAVLKKGNKAEPWMLVIVDEVHTFTQKTGVLGPVETLLSEGAKYGVRTWCADQRPARVSLELLGQAWVLVFFRLNPPDVKYLRGQDYPIEEWEAWTNQDYHFVMVSDKKWTPFYPVKL